MFFLILFSAIVFFFLSFVASLPAETASNPFTAFFQTETHYILGNLIIFIIGFVIALILFILSQKFDTHYSRLKNYFFSIIQVGAATVAGFFIAFAGLLCVACIQLNATALLVNTNPGLLGIQTDTRSIINTLASLTTTPQVIASDKDPQKELLAIANATAGTSNCYGKYFLAAIPQFLVIPVNKAETTLLYIDNTLIITALNPRDLQPVSPILGYLFLKDYFWKRPIKATPNITLMNRSEYATYRTADAREKVQNIDLDSKKLAGYISSLSATITQDKKQLTAPTTRPGSTTANMLEEKIKTEQTTLTEYQDYDTFFKQQKAILQNQENNVPNELGVFEPRDTIKIVLATTSSHAIADYFETVVHEYLHYTSYISPTKKFSDAFFEEGLTEYFARKIIQRELQTPTNLGYPVQVKIITEMTSRIPDSDLIDSYFNKDDAELIYMIDRAYGDGFYENNQLLFETLQYTSDPKQMLQLANIIMKKINGPSLRANDLFSNHSKL